MKVTETLVDCSKKEKWHKVSFLPAGATNSGVINRHPISFEISVWWRYLKDTAGNIEDYIVKQQRTVILFHNNLSNVRTRLLADLLNRKSLCLQIT